MLRTHVIDAEGGCGLQDKGHSAVVLKAMGRAINKTVTIGEPKPSLLHLHVTRTVISSQNGTRRLARDPSHAL